jgi:hypothetical protein
MPFIMPSRHITYILALYQGSAYVLNHIHFLTSAPHLSPSVTLGSRTIGILIRAVFVPIA